MSATLRDVGHAAMRNLLGNYCNGVCIFAIDANANDVQTGAAVDFFIGGVGYTYAIDAAIDISAEVTNIADIEDLPAGYTCLYVFEIDSAGAFTVAAGEQVLTADITAGTKSVDVPSATSDTVCPFAMLKVDNGQASAIFALGTTSLATAGVTDTYYNISRIPASVA